MLGDQDATKSLVELASLRKAASWACLNTAPYRGRQRAERRREEAQ